MKIDYFCAIRIESNRPSPNNNNKRGPNEMKCSFLINSILQFSNKKKCNINNKNKKKFVFT